MDQSEPPFPICVCVCVCVCNWWINTRGGGRGGGVHHTTTHKRTAAEVAASILKENVWSARVTKNLCTQNVQCRSDLLSRPSVFVCCLWTNPSGTKWWMYIDLFAVWRRRRRSRQDTQQTANRQTGQKMDLSLTAGWHTLPPSSTGSVLSGGSRTSKPVRKRIGSNRFRRTLGRGEKAKLARHLRWATLLWDYVKTPFWWWDGPSKMAQFSHLLLPIHDDMFIFSLHFAPRYRAVM